MTVTGEGEGVWSFYDATSSLLTATNFQTHRYLRRSELSTQPYLASALGLMQRHKTSPIQYLHPCVKTGISCAASTLKPHTSFPDEDLTKNHPVQKAVTFATTGYSQFRRHETWQNSSQCEVARCYQIRLTINEESMGSALSCHFHLTPLNSRLRREDVGVRGCRKPLSQRKSTLKQTLLAHRYAMVTS